MTPEQITQWAHDAGGYDGFTSPPTDWDGGDFVISSNQLQAFANLVRNATLEEAAITSWNHYMDTCKQRKMPAAHHEHFIAATTIRSLKN